MRSRRFVFVAFVAACVAAAGAYVALAAGGDDPRAAALPAQRAPRLPAHDTPLDPHLRLAVRATDPSDPRAPGRVYVVDPTDPSRRVEHRTECMRVYMAAGRGLCLTIARSGVDYRLSVLGPGFRVRRTSALAGLPSRTRVSPDGRYGAYTTFVTGDAYTNPGQFSTRTTLVDMASGRTIADLEQFTVIDDGRRLERPDFNFWGVTFARDSDRFYATLATAGHHYLVRGSVSARRVTVLRDGVECPSLSPDGSRIAYKRPIDGKGHWRLSVLDVATLRDHPLAETRSIDDQAEWIDDAHVAYGDGRDVWMVRADGGGKPTLLVRGASSPVALRR